MIAYCSGVPPEPPVSPGRIVLLNGASSSGKSSIAHELVRLLDDPHLLMSVDRFYGMLPGPDASSAGATPADVLVRRVQAGFHRAVAGMAAAGNHLVVDQVLSRSWRLPDLLTVLDGHDVTFVGVHCPPTELARRERARGDREVGQAAAQLPVVHAHGLYDIECDTSSLTPRACAERIARHLARRAGSSAFDRLRAAHGPDLPRPGAGSH
ncbi:chloramphenicol phosphotransferase CPT family protein [Streptomyces hebeiensis]|uniref:Chloramphenicol phosphotransferase CPT family protein n=1 Tax=Streptomyces hebeiensis TaxID=229486 RepID=A0ABN1V180_9ACTN